MQSLLAGLIGIALSGLTAAQSQTATRIVTVQWLEHAGRVPTDGLEDSYATVTWTGSVITAAPEATTYNLNLATPLVNKGLNHTVGDFTLVNGLSSHAMYQLFNSSTTYGEFCSISHISPSSTGQGFYSADPSDLDYDCTIMTLSASVDFDGDEPTSYGVVETFVNEYPWGTSSLPYGSEATRTFLPVAAEITEGVEMLELDPGDGGEASGDVSTGNAVEETEAISGSEGPAEESGTPGGNAVETSAEDNGVAGRHGVLLMLFAAGLVGAGFPLECVS